MKVEPADALIIGILVGSLVGDVELDKRDMELVSHRPLAKILVVLLAGHLWRVLPRWLDPFTVVGAIADRYPTTQGE